MFLGATPHGVAALSPHPWRSCLAPHRGDPSRVARLRPLPRQSEGARVPPRECVHVWGISFCIEGCPRVGSRAPRRTQTLAPWGFAPWGRRFHLHPGPAIGRIATLKLLSRAPPMTRQGQTNCEVGTQSHGPLEGCRATERLQSEPGSSSKGPRRDLVPPWSVILGRESSFLFLPAPPRVRLAGSGAAFTAGAPRGTNESIDHDPTAPDPHPKRTPEQAAPARLVCRGSQRTRVLEVGTSSPC